MLNSKIIIEKFKKVHKNKYNYSLINYTKRSEKVQIICKKHGVFEQTPNNHLSGSGCPKCNEKANYIHNNKYDYSLFTKYTNNKEKIKIICPEHGEFTQNLCNHLNGAGCPVCWESKGEKIIKEFLMRNKIDFTQYKIFEKCRYKNTLEFDFYLPKINTCIEFDGLQHYKSVIYFGGEESLKKSKLRDKIKNIFCKENNINLIRIRYDEDVEKKLSFLIN